MPEDSINSNADAQAGAQPAAEPQDGNPQGEATPKPVEKSFSQKEVDEIVEKSLKREREKAKAAQKTDAERISDLENRLTASERKNAVTAANCNPTFAKFVMHEVGGMDGDFSENLAKFKTENPQYFASDSPASSGTVRVSAAPSLAGGVSRTRADILNIKDDDERKKAISENLHLFKDCFN